MSESGQKLSTSENVAPVPASNKQDGAVGVKRVRVELELEDGTIRHVELTEIVHFDQNFGQWERALPLWRDFGPGELIHLDLHVKAKAGERSQP